MDLKSYLGEENYQRVPLSKSGLGHFHTAGSINGHPVVVLIDTGAASTVVDLHSARNLGLAANKLTMTGGGAGGANLKIYDLPDAVPDPRRDQTAAPRASGNGSCTR